MANICDFSMVVVGDENNTNLFLNALQQKGSSWIGRGAEVDIIETKKQEGSTIRQLVAGWCKWSIAAALILDSISMRKNPTGWSFGENKPNEFLTLREACAKYKVDVEVYSEEEGCGFQEHLLIKNGEIICDDCVDWYRHSFEEYDSKEEAESELGAISEVEWEDGCKTVGGFASWDFAI